MRGEKQRPGRTLCLPSVFQSSSIIFLIIIVLFGASKIPQIGKGLGEGIRNFKKGIKDGRGGQPPRSPRRPATNP